MMKNVFGFFFLALMATSVASQQPTIEPGSQKELRGVSTIHVAANSEGARASIVREINRRLPQLKIASRPEQAQSETIQQRPHLAIAGVQRRSNVCSRRQA